MEHNAKRNPHHFLQRIKRFSIRNKIVLYFVGFIFIITSLSGIYMSYRNYNSLKAETYSSLQMVSKQDARDVDHIIQIIENTAIGITASDVLYGWLNDPNSFDPTNSDFYTKKQELSNQINNELVYNNAWALNFVSTIAIYLNDNDICSTYTSPVSLPQMEALNKSAILFFRRKGNGVYSSIKVYNGTIYYYRRLKNLHDTSQAVTILVGIDESKLSEEYQVLVGNGNTITYIVDQQGDILSSNHKEMLGKTIDGAIQSQIDGTFHQAMVNKNIATFAPMENTGFTFVTFVPEYSISQKISDGMKSVLLIAVVSMLLFLFLGILISLRSTRFIKDIVIAMDSVRNKNYDTQMPTYGDQTLNEMSQSFNSMTMEINHLIKDVYEKQLLLKEMDIKFLQYQMNPHFLFNVLLTIEMKARYLQDDSIYKMVQALSVLLRASIYTDSSAKITIRKEMELVMFYLYLQKMRFEDKLTYHIECSDESIYDSFLPKLTIEPIVENAIVHGVEDKIGSSELYICLYRDKDDVIIVIKDDGNGFDVGKVFKETADSVIDRDPTHDKIGIKSTDQRLRLIYGDSYGLDIHSDINVGTEVRIRVPYDTTNRL